MSVRTNVVYLGELHCEATHEPSKGTITTDAPPADAFRVEGVEDVAVAFAAAEGGKCARCWKITPEVTTEDGICNRCEDVVNG